GFEQVRGAINVQTSPCTQRDVESHAAPSVSGVAHCPAVVQCRSPSHPSWSVQRAPTAPLGEHVPHHVPAATEQKPELHCESYRQWVPSERLPFGVHSAGRWTSPSQVVCGSACAHRPSTSGVRAVPVAASSSGHMRAIRCWHWATVPYLVPAI